MGDAFGETWLNMNEGATGLWEKADKTPLFNLAPIPTHPLMFPLTVPRKGRKKADRKRDEHSLSGPWPHLNIMMDANDAHNYRF